MKEDDMVDCFIEKDGIQILLVALEKFEKKSRVSANHSSIIMILKLFETLTQIEKSIQYIFWL